MKTMTSLFFASLLVLSGVANAQEVPKAKPAEQPAPAPDAKPVLGPDGQPVPVEAPVPVPEAKPAPPETPKPWAVGVSEAQKAEAQRLLAVGNKQFLESKHLEALATYRQALKSWDHPTIRFNAARSLINLDKPIEAHENIVAALKHGEAPLKNLYEEAKNYERLLASQIAKVEVRCAQAGVTVTLDGKPFINCPGEKSVSVLPGTHQVVGEKPGHLTLTRDVVVIAGATDPIEMTLVTLDDASITVRRWDRWKPWAVVGGGAVVGGLGILLELQARSSRSDYAELLADNCSEMPCEADFARGTLDQAKLEHALGVSAMVLGGAAVVAGVAGVILNRPRQILPESALEPAKPQVVPTLTTSGAGLSIVGEF